MAHIKAYLSFSGCSSMFREVSALFAARFRALGILGSRFNILGFRVYVPGFRFFFLCTFERPPRLLGCTAFEALMQTMLAERVEWLE